MSVPCSDATNAASMLRGSCQCGTVTYKVPDAFEYAYACHCSDCRRATGAASKPFAGIRADRLVITAGGEAIKRIGDERGHDARCDQCGSLLYSNVRDGRYAHVTLGTLIDEPVAGPSAHIFVGSKAAWEKIADGLPQFDCFPDS